MKVLRPLRFSLFLFLLAFPAACRAQQKIPPGVEVLSDVPYGTVDGRPLHLDIARPKNQPAKPMPVVLWLHGGGWHEGSHHPNVAIAFAAKGWYSASIEYRLSDEAKWPAQIEDCKLAIRWLRAGAAKWNIDPNRFGVWGISAGGHLAECIGTMDDKAGFDVGAHTEFSSRVQAIVAECGPSDFLPGSPPLLGGRDNRDLPLLFRLFGAHYDEKPALWKSGSPLRFVAPGDPPFLLIHGDADNVVPHADSEQMDAALQKAGVPVEFITVKNGNHVMMAARAGEPADPALPEIYQKIVSFFEKHLGPQN